MIRKLSSMDHSHVKHLAKLRLNRDYRYEHQSVIVAGIKPVMELISHCHVKSLLAYDETFIPQGVKADEIFLVDEQIMKKVSGMVSPEGLLAELAMPLQADFHGMKKVVALDAIGDPGNIGSLIRTALALGWDGIYLLENCCDPYNEKSLRAARGATFRIPIRMGSWSDLKRLIKDNEWFPVVADLKGVSPESLSKKERIILILSNEAHGPSENASALGTKVSIPMSGKMESLNVSVAGALLMYSFEAK